MELSTTAKEHLSQYLDDLDNKYAYLQVRGGGCSGFQYEWSFTDDSSKGILLDDTLVVDSMAEMFLLGCTIDYVTELSGSYLKVSNPNATASCGCGESFAVFTSNVYILINSSLPFTLISPIHLLFTEYGN